MWIQLPLAVVSVTVYDCTSHMAKANGASSREWHTSVWSMAPELTDDSVSSLLAPVCDSSSSLAIEHSALPRQPGRGVVEPRAEGLAGVLYY